MELPKDLYQLIGEFVLSYPKITSEAKNKLAVTIAALYSEYADLIMDNYQIPYFKDFKDYYMRADKALRDNAEKAIHNYGLEEYRDIIMENYTLTTSKLIIIADYCYQHTNDFDKTCRLYCALGYPTYVCRFENEDYLLNLINTWDDFVISKGGSLIMAQKVLLCYFAQMDVSDDTTLALEFKRIICTNFPFSFENIENLIKFVQEFDYFDLDYYRYKVCEAEESITLPEPMIDEMIHDLDKLAKWLEDKAEEMNRKYTYLSDDEFPIYTLLCNYYIYLFNKVNDENPLPAFTICAYSNWLSLNSPIISKYFPELQSTELQSLLFDYVIEKYENELAFKLNNEDDIVRIVYKLHYKSEISKYELSDIWVYFVIKSVLTYKHHALHETEKILQVSQTAYAEDGCIHLPWKYVSFSDGKVFFYHPNHIKGSNATLPFKFETEKSIKGFSDLGRTILWNFPFIACKSESGKITAIDEKFASYVINEISNLYQCFLRRKSLLKSNSISVKDILLSRKSEQFDFLEDKQLKKFEIVPIMEILSNETTNKEEPALLFTVGLVDKMCTLVYENASVFKATYIFIIDKNYYEKAVSKVISYFTSNKISKRTEIQYSRDMFSKEDGFLRVIRLIHDDNENWKSAINFYAKCNI